LQALQFTKNIQDMGQKLVDRIRVKSRHFIALHLRYELDMLAFSGCYYGGGEKEVIELGRIRKRWKTLHVRSFKRVVSLYKLLALGLVADDNQDMWC
jgi:hypothetical protein